MEGGFNIDKKRQKMICRGHGAPRASLLSGLSPRRKIRRSARFFVMRQNTVDKPAMEQYN